MLSASAPFNVFAQPFTAQTVYGFLATQPSYREAVTHVFDEQDATNRAVSPSASFVFAASTIYMHDNNITSGVDAMRFDDGSILKLDRRPTRLIRGAEFDRLVATLPTLSSFSTDTSSKRRSLKRADMDLPDTPAECTNSSQRDAFLETTAPHSTFLVFRELIESPHFLQESSRYPFTATAWLFAALEKLPREQQRAGLLAAVGSEAYAIIKSDKPLTAGVHLDIFMRGAAEKIGLTGEEVMALAQTRRLLLQPAFLGKVGGMEAAIARSVNRAGDEPAWFHAHEPTRHYG